MDLRPINPYYRKQPQKRIRTRLKAASGYSYPYTWMPPVTDRTQADVNYAKELIAIGWNNMTAEQRTEYLVGLKGCINTSDLSRIENNIQILIDVLELDNTSHVGVVPEFPTANYFFDMKLNVAAIRAAYCVHSDTPAVPELPYNTWQKYNDIEKILADVYEVISAQMNYYAGTEIYAGDTVGLLL